MDTLSITVLWLGGSVVVGIIAGAKGRFGFGYFVLSLLLSPVLIGLLALGLPAIQDKDVTVEDVISPKTHVRCPDCRELVRADARKCKHCGVALIPQKL
jgi:hypothetical protein